MPQPENEWIELEEINYNYQKYKPGFFYSEIGLKSATTLKRQLNDTTIVQVVSETKTWIFLLQQLNHSKPNPSQLVGAVVGESKKAIYQLKECYQNHSFIASDCIPLLQFSTDKLQKQPEQAWLNIMHLNDRFCMEQSIISKIFKDYDIVFIQKFIEAICQFLQRVVDVLPSLEEAQSKSACLR